MPRRQIPDADLLEHARAVFLEDGARARAADVARRAGVSEALLFKRFGSKQGMFMAAMARDFGEDQATWLDDLEKVSGQGDIPEHLVCSGIGAVDFFARMMPVVMMTWSSLPKEALAHHARPDAAPFASRRRMEAWFERERQLGRIRNCDTEIVARVYLGALFNHATWETTLGAYDPRPLGREAYVRGLVAVIWGGLAPADPDATNAEGGGAHAS